MNIGLVLSGGLAKGAYQIGALRAISEYFRPEEIEYISSSSVGALNAYAFSSDNLALGEKMWRGIVKESERLPVTKIMKSDYLKQCTAELAKGQLLSGKHYISLFKLKDMDVSYLDLKNKDEEHTALYLHAAVSMPVFSRGVKIDGKKYYDGGTVDNIPVYPLLQHGLDYIIAIYFDEYFSFEKTEINEKIIKIPFGKDTKAKHNSVWFTKAGTEHMIAEGYTRAKSVLERVFDCGTADAERIYGKIAELDAEHPDRRLRVTVDAAISALNKVARFVSKRRIVD